MAAARKNRRVAAAQPGFLSLDDNKSNIGKRKRVNKNKKKSWNKHSDIQDVEEFLDDVRLQERAAGGLIADKPDDSLFFVDVGAKKSTPSVSEPGGVRGRRGKDSRPLRIDLILQPVSHVDPPKDVLAHQQPNAKKLRRMAEKAEKLAVMGVLPRRQRLLQQRVGTERLKAEPKTLANNNPDRAFYDLWSSPAQPGETEAERWFLQQTKRMPVARPEKLNEKPSVLPAVEVIAPGGSYNPEFISHQALLQEAHDVEVRKQKEEQKLARQLAVKEDISTEESSFKEQLEGLIEEDEEGVEQVEEEAEPVEEDSVIGPAAQPEKKTEKQRKRERAERMKEQGKKAEREMTGRRQQLFKLRSIHAELKRREQMTRQRQNQRKAKQAAQKSQPRRLGALKFQAPDLEVQLSDEIPSSLRCLRPEGSILKDRFKSFQKRNLIEPRERAKFKRKYKLKYVEKRAFKEIK